MIYAVRVVLAGPRPTDEQLDAIVDGLGGYAASAGVADSGRLEVHLGVSASDPMSAGPTALEAILAAGGAAGLEVGPVSVLEVRLAEERDTETSQVYAAHVELDESQPREEQLGHLRERLGGYNAAVGVNDYGFLTIQLDLAAVDLTHAAERAEQLVLGAARAAGAGSPAIVQLELYPDPGELERRAELPPQGWIPTLLAKTSAAAALGVAPQQMNRYAQNGRFGVMRVGRDYLFPEVLIEQEARQRGLPYPPAEPAQ